MADKQSTMLARCWEISRRERLGQVKKIMDSLVVECWNGPWTPPRTTVLLRILRYTGDGEVSNASAQDCEDWGIQKAEMEEKRGRRIGIRSGVQADEIKRLGGLGERNGLSGHLDAFVA